MSRDILLSELRRQQGEFVSGTEIASRLGVSRTAVWKWIRELQAAGYSIESRGRTGYRLLATPDLLLPQEIRAGLSSRIMGSRIAYLPETESTNTWARELAEKGAPEGTVTCTELQTAGKGRLGRGWFSPPQLGLILSVIFRPTFPPHFAPRITLMAAVAVCRAIRATTSIEVGIKWPNDIYLKNRKVGGILVEMSAELDQIAYLVCGIGLNVNQELEDFPADLRQKATSLRLEQGRRINRIELARSVLEHLEQGYLLAREGNWQAILEQWRLFSVTSGRKVLVKTPGETFTGTADGIDDNGRLIVYRDNGELSVVISGDVEFFQ